MKTEEELRKLALDLKAGAVFTDRAIRSPLDLRLVFLPLGFMDTDQADKLLEQVTSGEVACFYEYMSEAGPSSVNGYPMFYSVNTLSQDEVDKIQVYLLELGAFLKPH